MGTCNHVCADQTLAIVPAALTHRGLDVLELRLHLEPTALQQLLVQT